MVRKRTGSAAPDGAADNDEEDLPPEVDPLQSSGADEGYVLPEAEKPVPAGHLKVLMKGQWRTDGDTWNPPGIHIMPRDQALHYVKTGAAEVKA
jgi:hypothetical protein